MELDLNAYWFEYATISLLAAILAVLVYIAYMGSAKGGDLTGWAERIQSEPVIVRTAIGAIVGILASFGLNVSDSQQGAIVAGIVVIAGLVAGFTRARVTPVEKLERQGYYYDDAAGRWRDADGRFASPPS